MIWIRRAIAVVLGILMIPVLVFTLLALRVNDTFLEEGFYKSQLQEADFYNFLYSDAIRLAIDEEIQEAGGLPLGVNLTTEEIVNGVQETLPPEWIQSEVEVTIDAVTPYLTGETDTIAVSVGLADRADVALGVVRNLVAKIDLHAALFDETIPQAIEDELGTVIDLPLGITLTSDEVVESLKRVITPELLLSQQLQAVDELGPYIIGRSDTFTFTIPLAEQAEAAEEELKRILRRADLQPYILEEIVDPALNEFLVSGVELPLGVTITRQEIRDAIEAALTPEWVDGQKSAVVDGTAPYLTGRSDTFAVTVPVRDRVDVALDSLTDAVDQKYDVLLASLPTCTSAQLLAIAQGGSTPTSLLCTVPGFTLDRLKAELGVDPLGVLADGITSQVPETITFTEQDLIAAIGSTEAADVLEDVRMTMRNGWSFDESDLRKVLTEQDPDSLDLLDNVRETIRDGWNWTEQDLRELIADPDAPDYEQNIKELDDVRGNINRVRPWRIVLPLLSLALLGIIGVTGGRKWTTKLGWAAGALFVSALVVFIASGPIYDSLAKEALEEERAERIAETDDQLEALLVEKGFDTGIQVGDAFLSGIKTRSLALFLVGGVFAVGTIAWSFVNGGSAPIRKPEGRPTITPTEMRPTPASHDQPGGKNEAADPLSPEASSGTSGETTDEDERGP